MNVAKCVVVYLQDSRLVDDLFVVIDSESLVGISFRNNFSHFVS